MITAAATGGAPPAAAAAAARARCDQPPRRRRAAGICYRLRGRGIDMAQLRRSSRRRRARPAARPVVRRAVQQGVRAARLAPRLVVQRAARRAARREATSRLVARPRPRHLWREAAPLAAARAMQSSARLGAPRARARRRRRFRVMCHCSRSVRRARSFLSVRISVSRWSSAIGLHSGSGPGERFGRERSRRSLVCSTLAQRAISSRPPTIPRGPGTPERLSPRDDEANVPDARPPGHES